MTQDKWNVFDFILVLLSVASVAVDFGTSQDLSFMPLLRVLRVARIFRLIPKAKGLRCAQGFTPACLFVDMIGLVASSAACRRPG
jgi:hypothetical protein